MLVPPWAGHSVGAWAVLWVVLKANLTGSQMAAGKVDKSAAWLVVGKADESASTKAWKKVDGLVSSLVGPKEP